MLKLIRGAEGGDLPAQRGGVKPPRCQTELLDVPSALCKARGDKPPPQGQPAPLPGPAGTTSLRSPQPLAELLCRRRKITESCVCASSSLSQCSPVSCQDTARARGGAQPLLLCPHTAALGEGWEPQGMGFLSPLILLSNATNQNLLVPRPNFAFPLPQGSKQGMIQERGSRAKAPRGTREQELLSVQGHRQTLSCIHENKTPWEVKINENKASGR